MTSPKEELGRGWRRWQGPAASSAGRPRGQRTSDRSLAQEALINSDRKKHSSRSGQKIGEEEREDVWTPEALQLAIKKGCWCRTAWAPSLGDRGWPEGRRGSSLGGRLRQPERVSAFSRLRRSDCEHNAQEKALIFMFHNSEIYFRSYTR